MNRTNVIEDLTLLPLPPWWQDPWILLATVLALAALIALGVWAARRRPRPAPARPRASSSVRSPIAPNSTPTSAPPSKVSSPAATK